MQDWSKMQRNWQKIRDDKKVPKGAGGTGVSLGDAANKVGEAQKKGVKPFIAELVKFDDKLKKYKTALQATGQKQKDEKEKKKYQSLSAWMTDNIEKWVKSDKEQSETEIKELEWVDQECGYGSDWITLHTYNQPLVNLQIASGAAYKTSALKAGGDEAALDKKILDGDFPLGSTDAPNLITLFSPEVLKPLANIQEICAAASTGIAKLYTTKPAIAVALEGVANEAKRVTQGVLAISKAKKWGEVKTLHKVAASDVAILGTRLATLTNAVKARIGS